MKKKAVIIAALLVFSVSLAAANDDANVQISEVYGDAFEEGDRIGIEYRVETNNPGAVRLVINEEVEATHEITGEEDDFPTVESYATAITLDQLGDNNFYAEFEDLDGEVYTSSVQRFEVVESDDPRLEDPMYREPQLESPDENEVQFVTREYRPQYGFETRRNLKIRNYGDRETFVSVTLPDTQGCQFFEVAENNQPTSGGVDFGNTGIYELLEAEKGVRGVYHETQVEIKVKSPTQQQMQEAGIQRLLCNAEVDASNGEAEDLTLQARPTDSLIVRSFSGLQEYVQEGEINVAGTNVSPLYFFGGLMVLLFGTGAAYSRFA